MTYNIQWFAEDDNPQRLSNLRTILQDIRPDLVAVQEVQSRKALEQIFPPSQWTIGMLDDPREFQEVGIAVRRGLTLVSSEMVFPSPNLDYAFPGRRDVLRAVVRTQDNKTAVFYVLHQKSRRGSSLTPRGMSGRNETDAQREMAAGLLAAYLAAQKDENSIVLGDMNDTPDDRSMNILESGNLLAQGGPVEAANPLMVNLTEPLYREDWVTIDLSRRFLGEPITAQVPGAMKSNEDLRGKAHRFPDDVPVTQSLFDQILVSPKLRAGAGRVSIFSAPVALRGRNGRTTRDDATGTVNYIEKGDRASDHLPVYVDLKLP